MIKPAELIRAKAAAFDAAGQRERPIIVRGSRRILMKTFKPIHRGGVPYLAEHPIFIYNEAAGR